MSTQKVHAQVKKAPDPRSHAR